MKKENKVIITSFLVNVSLSFLKLIFGFLYKSSALIADGFHSFSDLVTDVIAIVGNKLASKPADLKHPYGHGKFEYLTSLAIGIVIIVLGLNIIYKSSSTNSITSGNIVIYVSLFTVVFKYMLASYLIRKGKEYNNSILISSGKESSADVIGSLVVLISGFMTLLNKYSNLFNYADRVAAIIVGILIIKTGFMVLKENTSFILGEQEQDSKYIRKIKSLLINDENIKTIDNLVMLKYGPYYKLIGEVSMDPNLTLLTSHSIIEKIENEIKKLESKVKYINIHINPFKKSIDFNLRNFKKSDIDEVEKYLNDLINNCDKKGKSKSISKNYKYLRQSNYSHLKMIESKDEIIGMINYYLENQNYVLDLIYISPEYRRCGIGHDIIHGLISTRSNKNIVLSVSKNNEKAILFYKNIGFDIENETKENYNMIYK